MFSNVGAASDWMGRLSVFLREHPGAQLLILAALILLIAFGEKIRGALSDYLPESQEEKLQNLRGALLSLADLVTKQAGSITDQSNHIVTLWDAIGKGHSDHADSYEAVWKRIREIEVKIGNP